MADTVADTKETTTVGTPEKEDVEKKVDVADEDSKASTNGEVPKPKENGTGDEKDSAEDSQDKEVDSAECEDSTDSVQARGTKRHGNVAPEHTENDAPGHTENDVPEHTGDDVPESKPVEGASPEKKAKLDKPAEEEANATNGEPEAVA